MLASAGERLYTVSTGALLKIEGMIFIYKELSLPCPSERECLLPRHTAPHPGQGRELKITETQAQIFSGKMQKWGKK